MSLALWLLYVNKGAAGSIFAISDPSWAFVNHR